MLNRIRCKQTSCPSRGRKFLLSVALEMRSVLNMWIPKNIALKKFNRSPTYYFQAKLLRLSKQEILDNLRNNLVEIMIQWTCLCMSFINCPISLEIVVNVEAQKILTHGGDPLDSSIATPITDVKAPNHVRVGIIAPSIPSSNGTTII